MTTATATPASKTADQIKAEQAANRRNDRRETVKMLAETRGEYTAAAKLANSSGERIGDVKYKDSLRTGFKANGAAGLKTAILAEAQHAKESIDANAALAARFVDNFIGDTFTYADGSSDPGSKVVLLMLGAAETAAEQVNKVEGWIAAESAPVAGV